jgi:hypothetical protein
MALVTGGNQPRFGLGITARKQRDVMAEVDERIAEIGSDALGAP